MLGAYKLEKMNEMRDHSNCGTNTLCAYEHEWPLRAMAGFLENAKMNDDTQKLWIELDGAEEDGMFYLASPCKADLIVRKTTCQCKDYFNSDTVYSNIVVQASQNLGGSWFFSEEDYLEPAEIYSVRVEFPRDGDEDEFVHKFKFPGEGEVAFIYMPEDSTPDEWREMILKDGDDVNDPIMLEQAVRSMERADLVNWIEINSDDVVSDLYKDLKNDLSVIDRYENNYGQNTAYKSCVKSGWWKPFWADPDLDVECIKIKAEGYSDYKPNFCYERKWDKASKAEVGLIAGEVALGVAVGILASPTGPGSIAAYCATTTAVSAAGAWLLAGTMAGDKWPNGIIDQ
jgi:hypothetical protein